MKGYEDYRWQLEFGDYPRETELIPIGLYDGGDLLPDTVILDDSYTVYLKVTNPEYNCEVIIS